MHNSYSNSLNKITFKCISHVVRVNINPINQKCMLLMACNRTTVSVAVEYVYICHSGWQYSWVWLVESHFSLFILKSVVLDSCMQLLRHGVLVSDRCLPGIFSAVMHNVDFSQIRRVGKLISGHFSLNLWLRQGKNND